MIAGSKENFIAAICTSCTAGCSTTGGIGAAASATTPTSMTARTRIAHSTTIWPVIFGWIEQKYLYVPGLSKRCENCWSVSSTGDLNFCSTLTTLCGTSSRFVHVIVVPRGTDAPAGTKLKL